MLNPAAREFVPGARTLPVAIPDAPHQAFEAAQEVRRCGSGRGCPGRGRGRGRRRGVTEGCAVEGQDCGEPSPDELFEMEACEEWIAQMAFLEELEREQEAAMRAQA